MTRRASSVGRPTPGASAGTGRLTLAHCDTDSAELVCGFEGGRVVRVPFGMLDLPDGPRVVFAAPDDPGSGVVLVREDGSLVDCGADWVLGRIDGDRKDEEVEGWGLADRIAEKLRVFRKQGGLTQREMARRLGMAPPNYNRLEAGRHLPTTDTLLRIAEVMGISLGRLVHV